MDGYIDNGYRLTMARYNDIRNMDGQWMDRQTIDRKMDIEQID